MERIAVPGILDSLTDIGAFIMEASDEAGLDKRTAYKLRLAVDEIATNIITHGYEEAGREGDIVLDARIDDATLTITMEDSGVPYEPDVDTVPDSINQSLDERPIGGLGIFLTVRSVDDFRYEQLEDGNRYIFVMNRPGSESAG
ncbi:MAG: ATP-binding protein [Ignavibacteriae bacterium]|nr:ATP-binding protein [Ignavibacteriota bacterium]